MKISSGIICLSLINFVLSEIWISNSPSKKNSILLSESGCFKGDKYIFLNLDGEEADILNTEIQKVTWYTKKNICSTDRYNKKVNYQFPYNFKGTKKGVANPWDTTKVNDGSYVMYANIYIDGLIVKRYREPFCIRNDDSTMAPSMAPTMAPTSAFDVKCDDIDGPDGPDGPDEGSGAPTAAPTMAPTNTPESKNVVPEKSPKLEPIFV